MPEETDEIQSSSIEVQIKQVANQHRFHSLHDVLMVGGLEELRLKRSLVSVAEELEADLGKIEVEWICRVKARAYIRPVELFPEEFPEGLDPDEEIERIRLVWLAGIERAEANHGIPLVFDRLWPLKAEEPQPEGSDPG